MAKNKLLIEPSEIPYWTMIDSGMSYISNTLDYKSIRYECKLCGHQYIEHPHWDDIIKHCVVHRHVKVIKLSNGHYEVTKNGEEQTSGASSHASMA